MGIQSYWNGRVTWQSLPLLNLPAPENAPALKRLHLPQGDLAQLHNSAEPIHFLAWIELKPGAIRGNHVHRIKKEFVYFLEGRVELHLQDLSNGEQQKLSVAAGDLVVIEPGVAHALVPQTPGQALEFSPAQFDPADTIRCPLVEPAAV